MRHQRYCSVICALRQVSFFRYWDERRVPQILRPFSCFLYLLCIASITFGPPYLSNSIGSPFAPDAFLRLTLCIAFSTSDLSGGGSSVTLVVDLCWSLT